MGTHSVTVRTFTARDAYRVCRMYEDKHNIASRDFYARYLQGEFRQPGAIKWATAFEILNDLSETSRVTVDTSEMAIA